MNNDLPWYVTVPILMGQAVVIVLLARGAWAARKERLQLEKKNEPRHRN